MGLGCGGNRILEKTKKLNNQLFTHIISGLEVATVKDNKVLQMSIIARYYSAYNLGNSLPEDLF